MPQVIGSNPIIPTIKNTHSKVFITIQNVNKIVFCMIYLVVGLTILILAIFLVRGGNKLFIDDELLN